LGKKEEELAHFKFVEGSNIVKRKEKNWTNLGTFLGKFLKRKINRKEAIWGSLDWLSEEEKKEVGGYNGGADDEVKNWKEKEYI